MHAHVFAEFGMWLCNLPANGTGYREPLSSCYLYLCAEHNGRRLVVCVILKKPTIYRLHEKMTKLCTNVFQIYLLGCMVLGKPVISVERHFCSGFELTVRTLKKIKKSMFPFQRHGAIERKPPLCS